MPVQTRNQSSQTNQSINANNEPFNFDEASRLWRENKVSIGNGTYRYIYPEYNKEKNLGFMPLDISKIK